MNRPLRRLRTVMALGLGNAARVAVYRIGLKTGLHPVRRIRSATPHGPFFDATVANRLEAPAGCALHEEIELFGHTRVAFPPSAWVVDPLTNKPWPGSGCDWWDIPDFDPVAGDIKLVWELSRMDWVIALAQSARGGNAEAVDTLNRLLADWCRENPPYLGPNWKCGQEASIRVMRLATAALVLTSERTAQPGLLELVHIHLKRIAPTTQYAVGQQNNHATSEACALFLGGSWLEAAGDARGARYSRQGRALLESTVIQLVGQQGTFSQYSLNYHRVLLDTLTLAEAWRLALGLPEFSAGLRERAAAAAQWAYELVDGATGDGPNVGANDGAYLLPLSRRGYRDYRPSVQAAMALFARKRAYDAEDLDANLLWLGAPAASHKAAAPTSYLASDGGFGTLRSGFAMVMLRYPRFMFRPSQADALHVDLWVHGRNVLRDAGTFSYNTDPRWLRYFSGTEGHNTVQFDDRDQMPRLGRFLFGDWLRTRADKLVETPDSVAFGAAYTDGEGARHHRRIELQPNTLNVSDRVDGFRHKAVLRWRVLPGEWTLETHGSTALLRGPDGLGASIECDVPWRRCEMVVGWESRHYLEKTELPVLELEVDRAATFHSRWTWQDKQ